MSVLLIASSFITTLLIPAEKFRPADGDVPAGEASGRALAYLAHEFPRSHLRHRLRCQHNSDFVVRGRIGDGRTAQHRPALPAALRHGTGLDARDATAGHRLHDHRLRHHGHLQSGRECTGRGLRDGRACLNEFGGDCGNNLNTAS